MQEHSGAEHADLDAPVGVLDAQSPYELTLKGLRLPLIVIQSKVILEHLNRGAAIIIIRNSIRHIRRPM